MAIRKNVRNLTPTEKSDFVQAVKALKANGTYNQYVLQHVQAMNHATPPNVSPSTRNAAHHGPSFLPWHREYLRRYELDLQQVSGNSNLSLPYWDWATDTTLPSPGTAPVWNNDLMGGDGAGPGNVVTTGPFAYNAADPNTWTIIGGQGNPAGGLLRQFGVNTPTLPTQADVNAALNETPYDSSPCTGLAIQVFAIVWKDGSTDLRCTIASMCGSGVPCFLEHPPTIRYSSYTIAL